MLVARPNVEVDAGKNQTEEHVFQAPMTLKITKYDAGFLRSRGILLDDDCEIVMEEQMGENEITKVAEAALTAEVARMKRRGVPGPWCIGCGDEPAAAVPSFPGSEAFGFDDPTHRACKPCLPKIKGVAAHIFAMCSFPIVARADSRRREYEMQLYSAATEIYGGDDYDPETRSLPFFLAQANADADTKENFQETILAAFRRSKFTDFAALYDALQKEKDTAILRAIRRALRHGNSGPAMRALETQLADRLVPKSELQRLAESAIAKATAR